MTVSVLTGHVVDALAALEPKTFHCAVCSPPYWKLRAYGTPPQTWADGWSGELGQEDTPEGYLAHLLEVFASVRRVLRDDGTLWVNLAGCYWNDPGGQNGTRSMNGEGTSTLAAGRTGRTRPPKEAALHAISQKAVEANRQNGRHAKGRHPWLKPLDWVDLPGLFANAMQRDGWVWRSDVTWVKPSALPESVSGTRWERCRLRLKGQEPRGSGLGVLNAQGPGGIGRSGGITNMEGAEWADCPGCPKCSANGGLVLRRGNGRPTKATERVLLFGKRPGYFFDQEAVREGWADDRLGASGARSLPYSDGSGRRDTLGGPDRPGLGVAPGTTGRNLRDWWVVSPEPLTDAHYAAYPTALPERCIKAGTSEWGCCPACGAPWARVVQSRAFQSTSRTNLSPEWGRSGKPPRGPSDEVPRRINDAEVTTLGWRPPCRCPEEPPVPCRVLDPFGGSGSTGLAANRLGRDCTLVELKEDYAALARKRLSREPLSLFAYERPEEATV